MATLKVYVRSKSQSSVVPYVRYSIKAGQILYGRLTTAINTEYWDEKQQKLNYPKKPSDLSRRPIEEQNAININLNRIIDENSLSNEIIQGLHEAVTKAYNKHIGEFEEDWLQKVIDAYYEEFKPKPKEKPITLNQFIGQYINELETGKRLKKKSNTKVSEGTIKSVKGFRNQFDKYQDDRERILDFDDITMVFYRDYMSYMIFDTEYAPNTAGRMIKILKTIMFAARDLKLHDNREIDHPDFIANYVEVDNVYLTQERINLLYNMDLSENPAWEKVRDIFIIGCLTGQRVSDYKRINSNMITKLSNGLDYIELRQEKTNKTLYIPLEWRVKEILDKYNGTLPKTYDQKINDYMKKICEKAGFTETIEITEYKAGTETKVSKRFCDMVKTHTARRSLCTNMQQAGCKLSEIIAISGHESEEQLKTYLKLSSKEKAVLADTGFFSRSQPK